jgi:hypothetical protein
MVRRLQFEPPATGNFRCAARAGRPYPRQRGGIAPAAATFLWLQYEKTAYRWPVRPPIGRFSVATCPPDDDGAVTAEHDVFALHVNLDMVSGGGDTARRSGHHHGAGGEAQLVDFVVRHQL